MPPSRTSPLMLPSPSNALGIPVYVSCQSMEGLGAPLHAEDEAVPLDEAKVQARPPGLAVGCMDVRHMWETTGSGMGVMEEGVASVWKGPNFPEGACRGALSLWSARWHHRCDTCDVSLAPLLLEPGGRGVIGEVGVCGWQRWLAGCTVNWWGNGQLLHRTPEGCRWVCDLQTRCLNT